MKNLPENWKKGGLPESWGKKQGSDKAPLGEGTHPKDRIDAQSATSCKDKKTVKCIPGSGEQEESPKPTAQSQTHNGSTAASPLPQKRKVFIIIAVVAAATILLLAFILLFADKLISGKATKALKGENTAAAGEVTEYVTTLPEPEETLNDEEAEVSKETEESSQKVEETTVPETTVPETTVPETTIPETTAPETTAPETTAPAPEPAPPRAPQELSRYRGYWYPKQNYERELEIYYAGNNAVCFSLSYYRLTGLYDVKAVLTKDKEAAYFSANYGGVEGYLKFEGSKITLCITYSKDTYIEVGETVFPEYFKKSELNRLYSSASGSYTEPEPSVWCPACGKGLRPMGIGSFGLACPDCRTRFLPMCYSCNGENASCILGGDNAKFICNVCKKESYDPWENEQ